MILLHLVLRKVGLESFGGAKFKKEMSLLSCASGVDECGLQKPAEEKFHSALKSPEKII